MRNAVNDAGKNRQEVIWVVANDAPGKKIKFSLPKLREAQPFHIVSHCFNVLVEFHVMVQLEGGENKLE